MEILRDDAHAAIGELEHLGVIGGENDRLSDADVIERLLILLHADTEGLR